jgi:hypothetical protein
MNNKTIIIRVKNALNKLSSQDFQNLPTWQILDAFNHCQVEWCRRNLRGVNQSQEGAESSTSKIDDLEILLTRSPKFVFTDKGIFYESTSASWPADYLRYNRVALTALNTCCNVAKRFIVYVGEDANVDIYLNDKNRRPNYAWGETFVTFTDDKMNLYHNGEFTVKECTLSYYRQPLKIQMQGIVNTYTGAAATADVECEFNDDLCEVFISETAGYLAGNIESQNQEARMKQEAERNN